jgi:hypothetical protein
MCEVSAISGVGFGASQLLFPCIIWKCIKLGPVIEKA